MSAESCRGVLNTIAPGPGIRHCECCQMGWIGPEDTSDWFGWIEVVPDPNALESWAGWICRICARELGYE